VIGTVYTSSYTSNYHTITTTTATSTFLIWYTITIFDKEQYKTIKTSFYMNFTVDIRYGFFPIKSAFHIAFRWRNGFLSHKWTCPSKGVTTILQKGTIWGIVCFILLFDGTLQYLNRTNRSGLSFWLQWKLHFLERQWC